MQCDAAFTLCVKDNFHTSNAFSIRVFPILVLDLAELDELD